MKTCPNRECPDRVERGIIGEFADSAEVCPKCGTRLVEAPHDESVADDPSNAPAIASDLDAADDDDSDHGVELIRVLRTSDEAQLAMVRTLFDYEAIDYIVQGEIVEDFFGLDPGVGPAHRVVGRAEILVRSEHALRALALLRAEAEPTAPDEPEDDAGLT